MNGASDSMRPPANCTSALELRAGDSVGGRYRIERFLASGAMTQVYAGRDTVNNSPVAVRILNDNSAEGIEGFQLEAAAYSVFNDPHLPRLHSSGCLAHGEPYMVCDLLAGPTLESILDDGVLSIASTIQLGVELMSALHHVHCCGFFHCDVKPSNILLGNANTPTLKLIDFGICRRAQTADAGALHLDRVVGTAAYMSPEQICGDALDLRTDIYSAAVVLYRILTSRLPFEGRTRREIMVSALTDAIVPPCALREACPPELERALMHALCRDARFRYSSARALGDELAWIANRHHFALDVAWFGAVRATSTPTCDDVRHAPRASNTKHRALSSELEQTAPAIRMGLPPLASNH
jgi:serine/threonine-protein kinase